jgi:hypothetical protein
VVSQVETILVTCEMWGDLQKKRSNTKIFVHDARGAVAPTVSIEGQVTFKHRLGHNGDCLDSMFAPNPLVILVVDADTNPYDSSLRV